jgi:hypothetical protein
VITAHDKLKCVERELALRRKVYPRWISEGRMTHRDARYELDVMAEIAEDYRKLAEDEDKEGRLL